MGEKIMRGDWQVHVVVRDLKGEGLSGSCDPVVYMQCLGEEQPVAFVSGPSFAKEIVQGMATAVTVASTDRLLAKELMALFTSDTFRALYTPDVIGVEVGGAVKNVIAIAAGMSEGLGLGTNAMAALVTRGCGEMRRLVTNLGGHCMETVLEANKIRRTQEWYSNL